MRWMFALCLLLILCMHDHVLADGSGADAREIILSADLTQTDVRDYVIVRYNPLRTSFIIPLGACLEYEMWQHPDNVNFRGGVELMTERGRFTNQEIPDQNGVMPILDVDLSRYTRNQWYKRRFSLKAFEGYTISEIGLTVSCGNIARKGTNQTRYRNIRLVDEKGTVLTDFRPQSGWLPWPLIVSENYTPKVSAKVSGLASASFEPDLWLASNIEKNRGDLTLKNYDMDHQLPLSYNLDLVSIADTSHRIHVSDGDLELAAREVRKIPCSFGALAVGHWRPELTLRSGNQTSILGFDAISILTPEQFAARRKPFAPGGFGMGGVTLSGDGTAMTLPGLREQGANYYQIRFSWSQIEPAPGKYDFSRIHRILDIARRCGMWVQIDFYSGWPDYSVPAWYRGDLMRTNSGKLDKRNHAPIGYWSAARQAGLRVMRELLNEFGSNPSVIAWNAWTGGDMDSYYGSLDREVVRRRELNDYSLSSQEKFRYYVRDILQIPLNQAARRYELALQEWDDLKQPQPRPELVDLRPLWNDFMNYRLWSISQAQQEATSLIKSGNPSATQEYILGGALTTFRQGNDYDLAIEHAIATGGSVHQTAAPGSADQSYLGTAQRTSGMKFSIETSACPAPPHSHQLAFYQLASQGASAFTWIQSSGVMPIPSSSHGFGEYRPVFERISGAKRVGKTLAVVMPYSSQLVDFFGRLPFTPSSVIRELTDHLENSSINFDLYSDRRNHVEWSRYPIVMDGMSFSLETKAADALAQYVESGGKLVLFTRTGQFTPGNPEARFSLLKKLGCQMPDTPEERTGSVDMNLPEMSTTMSLRYWQSMGACPDSAKVLARTAQGEPALATWNVGKGTVYLWAGWPDMNRLAGGRPIVDQLLQRWGDISPTLVLPSNILGTILQKEKDYFVVLFNESSQYQMLSVPLSPITSQKMYAADIVARTSLNLSTSNELSLKLAPWDMKVIQLSPRSIELPPLDFPVRMRTVIAPKSALSAMQIMQSVVKSADIKMDTDGCVVIPSGTELNIPVASSGFYSIAASWRASGKVSILQNQKTIPASMASSAIMEVSEPAVAENQRIRFQVVSTDGNPILMKWLAFEPVWKQITDAFVSPVYENSGAFPGKSFNTTLPPEQMVTSSQDWSALTRHWLPFQAEDGCFDFSRISGDRGIIYIAWKCQSNEMQSSLLSLGVDYGLKLWLNGQEIFNSTAKSRSGAAVEDEFAIPIQLQKGTNIFVAKIAPGAQGWRLWARQID